MKFIFKSLFSNLYITLIVSITLMMCTLLYTVAIQNSDCSEDREYISLKMSHMSLDLDELSIDRANPQRTGFYPFSLLQKTPVLSWSKDYGLIIDSQPIIGSSMIYVIRGFRELIALDLDSGDIMWSRVLWKSIRTPPIYVNNTIIIGGGGDESLVTVLDADSGELLWSFAPRKINNCCGLGFDQGIIYCLSTEGICYALNAKTNTVLWSTQLSNHNLGYLAVLKNSLIIASDNGMVYKLNCMDGHIQWEFNLQHQIAGYPAVCSDLIYLTTKDGLVYALSHDQGKIQWSFNTYSTISTSPAVAEQWIVIACHKDTLYALCRFNGKILWQKNSPLGFISSPIISQDTIYIHTNIQDCHEHTTFSTSYKECNLLAIDLATGSELWRKKFEGRFNPLDIAPVIKHNKLVLISVWGIVYVLK